MLSEKVARLSVNDDHSPPDPATQSGASTISDGEISNSDGSHATRDVTQEFNEAAKALRIGLVVKDPDFTLYDSVGALEIMDPKMDSGFAMGEESSKDAYDVLKELSPSEVIGIMDQLFCFEMAWHDGFPLTQCLFASRYIDHLLGKDPKTFEEANFHKGASDPEGNDLLHTILRAYCLALIKTCDFVHLKITRERYHEDEDFSANLYNRKLLSGIDQEQINQFLQEALVLLEHMDMADELRDALQARLQLRHLMLYGTELESSMTRENTQPWHFCVEMIPKIESTHQFGTHVPGAYGKMSQPMLASTMPPRDLVEDPFEEVLTKFSALCRGLEYVYFILYFTTPFNMLNFTRYIMSVDPQPSVYVRCTLQALIWHNNLVLGTLSYQELIIADLEDTVLPSSNILNPANQDCEVPYDPRFKMAKTMERFYNRVVDYMDMFVALCMNRARQLRMLTHLVVEWGVLEPVALEYDDELRLLSPPPKDLPVFNALQLWAGAYKLRHMQAIVQMGFELNLYQMDEMAGMYWFVYHLCLLRMMNLEQTMSHLKERLPRTMVSSLRKGIELAIEHQQACFDEAHAVSCLADSLSCLYSFFAHVGLIPAPYRNVGYADGEQRFFERVEYFWRVDDPPRPIFEDFLARVALRATPEDNPLVAKVLYRTSTKHQALGILELAGRKSQMAKEAWQNIAKWPAIKAQSRHCDDKRVNDAKNVMKACITANMRIADFKKTLKNIDDSNIKDLKDYLKVDLPTAEAAHHKWWLVPQAVTIDEAERRKDL